MDSGNANLTGLLGYYEVWIEFARFIGAQNRSKNVNNMIFLTLNTPKFTLSPVTKLD
jgi:hypothetical protein